MHIIDIVTIAAAIVFLLIGFVSGFGRSLRHFTNGIVGVIISVFVCAALGGMVLGIDVVTGWIEQLNAFFASKAEFLGKIQLGVIIFYAVMFFAVQILRVIVVKVIAGIFETDNSVMRVINKSLGMIFVPTTVLVTLLLVFAVFNLFEDTAFIGNLLQKMEGTFLMKLYEVNPIIFHV